MLEKTIYLLCEVVIDLENFHMFTDEYFRNVGEILTPSVCLDIYGNLKY